MKRGSAETSTAGDAVHRYVIDALGVTRSLSRPQISDDNPYAESQFKTLKYRKDSPDRFGSPEDTKVFFCGFFDWYNHEHRHSGIAMLTPPMVHAGADDAVLDSRRRVMLDAYAAPPERFNNGQLKRAKLPMDVRIDKPDLENAA